ncbi:MAG: glucose 1-dehydrogenase [Actinobacteria bacterium]|nr:glucose 1-dehydrogenase [Actinomycetota bacterium]
MTRDPRSLEGKLVLVTGAGVGIGQGVALEVAREGADVALHYSSSAQGTVEAVEQITAMGRRAIAIQGDLGKVADCYRVVDEAATFLGGLDALVNNAGVTATLDFLDVTEEQFNRIYNINIRGQFFCAQQAIRHILEHGREQRRRSPEASWSGGSIVNISSVHAFAGVPGHSIYAGAKGAINAFTRELAVELCPAHVRVNVLAPGPIEVPRYWKLFEDYTREAGNALTPWKRIGLPADVAYAAAFLISDAAEYITGQVIYLDGGMTAKLSLPVQPPRTER